MNLDILTFVRLQDQLLRCLLTKQDDARSSCVKQLRALQLSMRECCAEELRVSEGSLAKRVGEARRGREEKEGAVKQTATHIHT
jgi:hypothetical protein